jgi:hypothetical protein
VITYNRKDYNLPKIEKIVGDFNYHKTVLPYYIYGLKQDGNPPVLFTQNMNNRPSSGTIRHVAEWLKKNGIASEVEDPDAYYIGIRKDVRAYPEFTAALIRTLVAYFEDALKLNASFKIPKISLKRSSWRSYDDDEEE